jgi:hypothetical protein
MWLSDYVLEEMARERIRDALHAAEQVRLARSIRGRPARRWLAHVVLALKNLPAILGGHGATERQSPSPEAATSACVPCAD